METRVLKYLLMDIRLPPEEITFIDNNLPEI